jgi:soluble lytic murein transglycosylase-like protein
VRSLEFSGDTAVLTLRSGGEIVCPRAMIAEVLPDEVPYPEPSVEAEPSPVTVAPLLGPSVARERLPNGKAPFGDLIKRASAANGVDPLLVQAVIQVESKYQRKARSRAGAMGLMQLMPETARRYAVRRPYDPATNIDAGTRHLRSLLNRYPIALALAAYNAGEAAVDRFQGIPLYAETRDYVSRILQLIEPPADKH